MTTITTDKPEENNTTPSEHGKKSTKNIFRSAWDRLIHKKSPTAQEHQTPDVYDYSAQEKILNEAESPYIVPKHMQPGKFDRFMLKQGGGMAPQYYTKDEAKKMRPLAYLKMFAAGSAGFSLTEMLHGITKAAHSINFDIGDVHITSGMILTPVIAATSYMAISKLDTLFVHNMRVQKAAKELYDQTKELGRSLVPKNMITSGKIQKNIRTAVVAGSMLITIPTLYTYTLNDVINKRLAGPHIEQDKEIRTEYETKLQKIDSTLTVFRSEKKDLKSQLLFGNTQYSDDETQRKYALSEQISILRSRITQTQKSLSDHMAERDNAQADMENERSNALGNTQAGKGPKFRAAEFKYNQANDNIKRLEKQIKGDKDDLQIAEAKSDAIRLSAEGRSKGANVEGVIREQIADVDQKISEKEAERKIAARIDELLEQDHRYHGVPKDLGPRLMEAIKYTLEHPAQSALPIGLMLILASIELGMVAGASVMPVNPGERRAIKAQLAKAGKELEIFEQFMNAQGQAVNDRKEQSELDKMESEAQKILAKMNIEEKLHTAQSSWETRKRNIDLENNRHTAEFDLTQQKMSKAFQTAMDNEQNVSELKTSLFQSAVQAIGQDENFKEEHKKVLMKQLLDALNDPNQAEEVMKMSSTMVDHIINKYQPPAPSNDQHPTNQDQPRAAGS